ncbi:hypothetical protein OC834_006025 [Tilletia horrida]|nr:hypothetical protein OC834_006025 [Tilletia horrida]
MCDAQRYCDDLKVRIARALDGSCYKTDVSKLVEDHLSLFHKQSLLYEAAQDARYASNESIAQLRAQIRQEEHDCRGATSRFGDVVNRLYIVLQEQEATLHKALSDHIERLRSEIREQIRAVQDDPQVIIAHGQQGNEQFHLRTAGGNTSTDTSQGSSHKRRKPAPDVRQDAPAVHSLSALAQPTRSARSLGAPSGSAHPLSADSNSALTRRTLRPGAPAQRRHNLGAPSTSAHPQARRTTQRTRSTRSLGAPSSSPLKAVASAA